MSLISACVATLFSKTNSSTDELVKFVPVIVSVVPLAPNKVKLPFGVLGVPLAVAINTESKLDDTESIYNVTPDGSTSPL